MLSTSHHLLDRSTVPASLAMYAGEWLLLVFPPLEQAITAATGVPALCDALLAFMIDTCGASAGQIALCTPHGKLVPTSTTGFNDHESVVPAAPHLAQAAITEGRASARDLVASNTRERLLTAPFMVGTTPLGVLQLITATPPPLQELEIVCARIGAALHHGQQLAAAQQHNARWQALAESMGQIGATLDRDQILTLIIDAARRLINAEASSLFLLDPATGDALLHTASGSQPPRTGSLRVPAGQGIIGHVLHGGETVLVADVAHDARHYRRADQHTGFVTRSLLTVPLRTQPINVGDQHDTTPIHTIGGLQVINKLDGVFTPEDAQVLEVLARQAATVFEIATLYRDAHELFLDMIRAFSTAIDAKDPYTEGHSQRVSDYAVAIAQELGQSASFVHHVRVGATLHDIGKIGVPDAVLRKPDALSFDEYAQVKLHPLIGAHILEHVRLLQVELPALTEHHERLDGSGYPQGLQGDAISLLGRIVAVADVFDALASDRPYRPAFSADQTLAYLQNHAGTLFDAACVEALVRARAHGNVATQAERAAGVHPLPKDEHP